VTLSPWYTATRLEVVMLRYWARVVKSTATSLSRRTAWGRSRWRWCSSTSLCRLASTSPSSSPTLHKGSVVVRSREWREQRKTGILRVLAPTSLPLAFTQAVPRPSPTSPNISLSSSLARRQVGEEASCSPTSTPTLPPSPAPLGAHTVSSPPWLEPLGWRRPAGPGNSRLAPTGGEGEGRREGPGGGTSSLPWLVGENMERWVEEGGLMALEEGGLMQLEEGGLGRRELEEGGFGRRRLKGGLAMFPSVSVEDALEELKVILGVTLVLGMGENMERWVEEGGGG